MEHQYQRYANARRIVRESEINLGSDSWQLFLNGSFGDTYVTINFLEAFRKTHQGPIKVILRESYRDMQPFFFPSGIDYLLLSRGQFDSIESMLFDAQESFDFSRGRLFPTLVTCHPYLPEMIVDARLSHVEVIRALLRLPPATPFYTLNAGLEEEFTEKARDVLTDAGGIAGNSIILNPANNTHKEFSPEFWARIAKTLNGLGYKVFTNTSSLLFRDSPSIIPFTTGIILPPHLATAIIDCAGTFISGVNGLLTISALFCRSAKRVQLDYLLEGDPSPTKGEWKASRRASSNLTTMSLDMREKSNYFEIAVNSENDAEIIQKILQSLNFGN